MGKLIESSEEATCEENCIEFWLARDLQAPLEREEWRSSRQSYQAGTDDLITGSLSDVRSS